jgi:hypothetical protein
VIKLRGKKVLIKEQLEFYFPMRLIYNPVNVVAAG